jgi:NADH-quinone oxidoreductase subunit H
MYQIAAWLAEYLALVLPLLIAVAYLTLLERKAMASMHQRRGHNTVGPFVLLQPFADGLKLLVKEKTKKCQ